MNLNNTKLMIVIAKRISIFLLLFTMNSLIHGQVVYTLQGVIDKGLNTSLEYKRINIETQKLDLSVKRLEASLGYKLDLYGQLPAYTNSNFSTIQNDGNIAFQSVNYNNSLLGLSLSKSIWQTGGQLQLTSELQRFDNFNQESHSYNGIPLRLSYHQNLLGYNPYTWQKTNNKLKQEINSLEIIAKRITIKQQINGAYFNILKWQNAISSNQSNVDLAKTLLNIALTKDSLGVLSKRQLIQLKLQLKNASSQLNIARINYNNGVNDIAALISTSVPMSGEYLLPEPHVMELNHTLILEIAIKNSPRLLEFKRRIQDSKQLIKEKSKEYGPYVGINASVGFIRSDIELSPIYRDAKQDQSLSISFNIPILDGKRRQTEISIAEIALLENINNNEQQRIEFEKNISNIVSSLQACQDRLQYAKEIRTMAIENLEINTQVYKIGAINITELNIAIREKDQALNYYLSEVEEYWSLYYQLQYWTLWDYKEDKSLLEN